MLRFILRRVLVGLLILFIASAIIYWMVSVATDFQSLTDLESSTAPNKAQLIADRVALLRLDEPWYLRYIDWLGAFVTGDLGTGWRSGTPVSALLGSAMVSTLKLVSVSSVLAIVLGVSVGVVSALRQYSTFDYVVTFVSFLLYALPAFWVAVLLKQYGAIGFNDFLNGNGASITVVVLTSVILGLAWMFALGGDTRRRVINGVGAALITAIIFVYLNLSDWWHQPQFGPVALVVMSLGVAVGVTTLSTGLRNRRALLAALTCAALGGVLYFPMHEVFRILTPSMSLWLLALGGIACIAVGALIGWLWGGPDRGQSMRTAAIVAPIVGFLLVTDKIFSYWPAYSDALGGRPVPTIGDVTPNLGGNFWVQQLDIGMHLLLPTISLLLISFASYTRYSRGSMLEVMNQDYIRTARAKGLPERTVVMRHGFRNSLIPLATIVPLDVITLFSGAIITEFIFGRPGMGQMFVRSLNQGEIEPVMAYLMVVAALSVLANIVADLIYAALDPRIRVDA